MKNLGIKISIFVNYFVFAILLNSVGIVIARSIEVYQVSESEASLLEAFKDLPIAVVSFLVASFELILSTRGEVSIQLFIKINIK